MKTFAARVYAVTRDASGHRIGRPTPLSRETVTAATSDQARLAVRDLLTNKKHKVISINHSGASSLVAYVEVKK